jgi:hypothetical protein
MSTAASARPPGPKAEAWFARMFRGRRLDRNPLRRPSDRAETIIGIMLLVAFFAAAPFTARAAAAWTRALAEHARITALSTRYEVTAITLEEAPSASSTLMNQTWVGAQWTAPDRRQRTGPIQVPASTQKGSSERIWVAANGDVVAPPLPVAELAALADRAAFAAITVLICLFLIAGSVFRHVINRQHLAAWDAEWAVTEPRWNH